MDKTPTYGTVRRTKLLDDDGSKVTIEEKFVAGTLNRPVRNHYEIKSRVTSQKEEHALYLAFSDDINSDTTKLDPSFKIEKTQLGKEKGFYYVVTCYTRLEY